MTYFFGFSMFFVSIVGMGGLIALKMPELKSVRFETKQGRGVQRHLALAWRRLFKSALAVSESISWEVVLQKILSKIKLIALRVETWANKWLCQTRERSRRKKENQAYWKKLSKLSVKKKKK